MMIFETFRISSEDFMGFHTKYDVQFPRLLVHAEPMQKQHI